jgi:hypothetical protein
MIMQNVARVQKGTQQLKFDLKGSLHNRRVKAHVKNNDCAIVLKDVNFIEIQKTKHRKLLKLNSKSEC